MLVLALGCGPGKGDGSDEVSTGEAATHGAGENGAPTDASGASVSGTGNTGLVGDEGTGSDPGTTSTTTTTTTTGSSSTADPTGADTSEGDVTTGAEPPATILIIVSAAVQQGELSAFDELTKWQPEGPEPDCEGTIPVCDTNTPPVIGPPSLFLNGAWADIDTPIHVGDRVGIVYPFADAECNVACGTASGSAMGLSEGSSLGQSLQEFPCATGPGLGLDGLGLDFGHIHFAEQYMYNLALTDVCEVNDVEQGMFQALP